MKIAQIVAPGASEYERKSQRVDLATLTEAGHQVAVYQSAAADADVAHVYGRIKRVRVPHVVDAELEVPEAVEDLYWSAAHERRFQSGAIGTALRKDLNNVIQQTYLRISRTRDDIDWRLFERPPSPAELVEIAVWVDPALDDDDRDGFVAEALVAGNVVVASRTPTNVQRLEKGRTGFLVPPNDPNELTHAILAALFKPELGQGKTSAARQTISKFRPRQRLRALIPIYESLLR
jgi:hypothetical protein